MKIPSEVFVQQLFYPDENIIGRFESTSQIDEKNNLTQSILRMSEKVFKLHKTIKTVVANTKIRSDWHFTKAMRYFVITNYFEISMPSAEDFGIELMRYNCDNYFQYINLAMGIESVTENLDMMDYLSKLYCYFLKYEELESSLNDFIKEFVGEHIFYDSDRYDE